MGLGNNDPWVESHMWPQQTWVKRLSWGQWPLLQVFEKKVTVPHTLMYFQNKYYNFCKNMWSQKQARLVVWELPYLYNAAILSFGRFEITKVGLFFWLKFVICKGQQIKTIIVYTSAVVGMFFPYRHVKIIGSWRRHSCRHNSSFKVEWNTCQKL